MRVLVCGCSMIRRLRYADVRCRIHFEGVLVFDPAVYEVAAEDHCAQAAQHIFIGSFARSDFLSGYGAIRRRIVKYGRGAVVSRVLPGSSVRLPEGDTENCRAGV